MVIGDGKQPIALQELRKILDRNRGSIEPNPLIILSAHGVVVAGRHYVQTDIMLTADAHIDSYAIRTSEMILCISQALQYPVSLMVQSCFGGAAAIEAPSLLYGGSVITVGFHDEVAWRVLDDYALWQSLELSIPGLPELPLTSSYARFVQTILTSPSLQCSFAPSIPGVEPFAFRPIRPKHLTSREVILLFQRAELSRFAGYCLELLNKGNATLHEQKDITIVVNVLRDCGFLVTSGVPPAVFDPPAWCAQLQNPCLEKAITVYYECYQKYVLRGKHPEELVHVKRIVEALIKCSLYPEEAQAAEVIAELSQNYEALKTPMQYAKINCNWRLMAHLIDNGESSVTQQLLTESLELYMEQERNPDCKFIAKLIKAGAEIKITAPSDTPEEIVSVKRRRLNSGPEID